MAAPERRVRHLRLVAGTREAARAALPRLEDALRCASLPDGGARLLLVRRLVLGALDKQAPALAISRTIEARFAEPSVTWIAGDAHDACHAERVVFASAWHARVALSCRLLRGQPCDAWYWPLAVPEYRRGLGPGENLRSIAGVLAQSAESRVALPAWAVRVVQECGWTTLCALVPGRLGDALQRMAGVTSVPDLHGAEKHQAIARLEPSVPDWLRCLLVAGRWSVREDRPAAGARRQDDSAPATPPPAFTAMLPQAATAAPPFSTRTGHGLVAQVNAVPDEWSQRALQPAVGSAAGSDRPPLSGTTPTQGAEHPPPAPPVVGHAAMTEPGYADASPTLPIPQPDGFYHPAMASTNHGGLFFLLPIMKRLGLPDWCDSVGADSNAWARAVLASAMARLQAHASDPLWALVFDAEALHRVDAPAPACWQNPLLAGPRRHAHSLDRSGVAGATLAQRLVDADCAAAQTELWVTALRRWLRRAARIGLASLVTRQAQFVSTPTHLDVFFRLTDADLRIRRLGLDVDPGWLYWFGRVVAYHYGEPPQLA